MDLQFVGKESRTIDAAVLEEQVHQMLREWKAELNEPSPASSLQQGGSLGSFSTDICRLLQLCEEEDDASSLEMSEDEPVRVGSESIKENGNPNFPGTDSAGNEPKYGEQRLQFEQLHTTLMKGHSDVGVGPVLDVYVGAVAVTA
ncbi:Transcription factor voz1 [Lathyrus oleraceus]|nr:Transcription factor voz1 [Pisum sativum]